MRALLVIAVVAALLAALWLRVSQNPGPPAAPAPAQSASSSSQQGAHSDSAAEDSPRASESVAVKLARAFQGTTEEEAHKLTSAELGEFLNKSHFSAASLVTAFEASRDKEFLKQAAQSYPNDPFVQAKVLMHDLFPEEREKWLARMKASDPDNSFPHLLAAADLMKKGDATAALAEIAAASGKRFDDFTHESAVSLEEAYLTAGRNPAEAKAFGSSEILLPHLAQVKSAAIKLAEAAAAAQASDGAPAQPQLLNGVWQMGRHLRDSAANGGILINDLVGLAMENIALSRWPSETPAPFGDPQQLFDQNKARRAEARQLSQLVDNWINQAPSDNELIVYFDRMRLYGEWEAMKWLKARHPELTPAIP